MIGADNLVVASLVQIAVGKVVDVLYRAIGHQQPMLIVKVAFPPARTLDCIFDAAYILRMNALQYPIRRRFCAGCVPVNPS